MMTKRSDQSRRLKDTGRIYFTGIRQQIKAPVTCDHPSLDIDTERCTRCGVRIESESCDEE